MVAIQTLAGAWHSFFFDPIPVTTIAAFRLLFGCLLTVNAFHWVLDRRRYLCVDAVISLDRLRSFRDGFSLFRLLPASDWAAWTLLTMHVSACVSLTAGLMTRTSAAVVFLTMVSFHRKNPCILHSGDSVLKLITFLLIFSSAGEAFSIDHVHSNARHISLAAPWSQRLMQIQISIVYLRSVYWKLRGVTWRDGSAVYYATRLYAYRRSSLPLFLQGLPLAKFLTRSALAIEMSLGSLIWIDEFRNANIVAGILLHLGIELWMNVHLFGWTMMVCLLLFVDPADLLFLLSLPGF